MAHELPNLPYGHDTLAPHIDAKTMQIHHEKHHGGYVSKLNAALEQHPDLHKLSVEELISDLSKVPEAIRTAVRNNGGGHANHSLFWTILTPDQTSMPTPLKEVIDRDFGSIDDFKKRFADTAANRFGSGWAWLVVTENGKLDVCSTPNQDNPLMQETECTGTPILGLDVWEHAYYLNYQNKRPDYIQAFWSIVNWDEVQRRYQQLI